MLYNSLPTSLCVFIIVFSTVCLRDMLKYTANVREWMSADPKNVIAIHCKGGKGDAKDPHLVSISFKELFELKKTVVLLYSLLKMCIFHSQFTLYYSLPQDAQVLWCAPGSLTVTSLRAHRYIWDLVERGLMNEQNISKLFLTCVSVCPPGQSGVFWREEDRQESELQVSGSGDSLSGKNNTLRGQTNSLTEAFI